MPWRKPRLWAGYGELVGENSISPGKPCEMHMQRSDNACLFVWVTVVGIGISCVIVHSRWIEVAWQPHVIAGQQPPDWWRALR